MDDTIIIDTIPHPDETTAVRRGRIGVRVDVPARDMVASGRCGRCCGATAYDHRGRSRSVGLDTSKEPGTKECVREERT